MVLCATFLDRGRRYGELSIRRHFDTQGRRFFHNRRFKKSASGVVVTRFNSKALRRLRKILANKSRIQENVVVVVVVVVVTIINRLQTAIFFLQFRKDVEDAGMAGGRRRRVLPGYGRSCGHCGQLPREARSHFLSISRSGGSGKSRGISYRC